MQTTGASISDEQMRAGLTLLREGLGVLADRPLALLGNADLLALNRELTRFASRLQAARLAQLAEIDTRGAALEVGAGSTLAWVKTIGRVRHGHAVRDLRLARGLVDRYQHTADALAAGEVNVEHAEEIRSCLDALPDHIDPDTRVEAEQTLLETALVYDPRALHRLGQHLHTVLDPDGPEDVADAEADAFAARALFVQPYDDGRVGLRGILPPETGSLLLATLDPLAEPRDADPATSEADLRTTAQRRADALGDILRLAGGHPEAPISGGARPTIFLTLSYDALRDQVGAGTLDGGTLITPQTARCLACDADVIPAVLGSADEPLAVGRRTRVVPAAIRAALILRDRHCRYPGCRRRPARCHAHHIQHWADHGPTDLDNLVLLCDHHHRVVHRDGWTITPRPGHPPTFTPPAWAQPP